MKSKEQKRVEARFRQLRKDLPSERLAVKSMQVEPGAATAGFVHSVKNAEDILRKMEKEFIQVQERIKIGWDKKPYYPGRK